MRQVFLTEVSSVLIGERPSDWGPAWRSLCAQEYDDEIWTFLRVQISLPSNVDLCRYTNRNWCELTTGDIFSK